MIRICWSLTSPAWLLFRELDFPFRSLFLPQIIKNFTAEF